MIAEKMELHTRSPQDRGEDKADDKKFVQLGHEFVCDAAESLGISELPPDIAKSLAGDTSYRLRDVVDVCTQILQHSRKRKLTTEIFNKALKIKHIEPVIGYGESCTDKSTMGLVDLFERVPDLDLYVEKSSETNLMAACLTPPPRQDRDHALSVTASWACVQGMKMPSNSEDNKVVPSHSSLNPALVQYFTTLTTRVLGDSEKKCRMMLKDVRCNPRLTLLLPYLVTFVRTSVNKYREKQKLVLRIIRLISALFCNRHLNLAPKPYLSYLVSALLSSIMMERRERNEPPPLQHVQMAASVLKQALERWETPINQLRTQSLKALKDYCNLPRDGTVTYSQLGVLTALSVLGPKVVVEVLSSRLESMVQGIAATLSQLNNREKPLAVQILLTLLLAGGIIIRHWRTSNQNNQMWPQIDNMYKMLYSVFGDSVLCYVTSSGQERKPRPKDTPKMRLNRITLRTNPVAANRQEPLDLFGVDLKSNSPKPEGGLLSQAQSFQYLADMGVPSDIFEPTTEVDSTTEKVDQDMMNSLFRIRVVPQSDAVKAAFPDCIPLKMRPRAVRLMLGPCKQVEPEKYKQRRPGQSLTTSARRVAWRNFSTGGRQGMAYRRKTDPHHLHLPDYCSILQFG